MRRKEELVSDIIVVIVYGILGTWTLCWAQTEVTMRVPRTVDDCYAQALLHPIDPKSAKVDCLQRLMWFYEPDQNLTIAAYGYFSNIRGTARGDPVPKTGFRTRREYRRLSDVERNNLHEAFNQLYQKGILRRYADLHRNAIETARDGAAFLAWHRVFLAMFEDELRLVDPSVALPYWDSTMDYSMDNGINSIVWSLNFFGNGNGEVNTGPYAGWITSRGRLWRRYGREGKLISPAKIAKVMTRCQTDEIVFPIHPPESNAILDFILEYHSNGVHKWVGGDMADGYFAGYDPVFYMHLAYVDFVWEFFRHRQKTRCGINPETAYASPPYKMGHGPEDLMFGFSEFKNIDGLKGFWTKTWYDYEVSPECPNCGSNYLYCDQLTNHCTSHSRRTDFNVGQYQENPMSAEVGLTNEPFEPLSIVLPKRTVYVFNPAPPNDPRTFITARADAKRATLETLNDRPPLSPLDPWVENLERRPVGPPPLPSDPVPIGPPPPPPRPGRGIQREPIPPPPGPPGPPPGPPPPLRVRRIARSSSPPHHRNFRPF